MSRRLGGSVNWDSLGIEHHQPDGSPIASSTAPPFWIRVARTTIELVAVRQDLVLPATVTLIGSHVSDCAMPMLTVVPADEASHPALSASHIGKWHVGIGLDAVNVGLARDRERRENEETLRALRARFEVLTSRERAILTQVAEGRLNKQIADDLGITETTVKVHRSNAMRKIKATSVAELCRIVDKLKLLPESAAPW